MTPLYRPRPERWPQWRFSLRTFFVLLTLFCVWLGVQVKWIKDRHEALTWYGKLPYGPAVLAGSASVRPAPWSIRVLGEPGYKALVFYRDRGVVSSDEFLRAFHRTEALFPEATVQLASDPTH